MILRLDNTNDPNDFFKGKIRSKEDVYCPGIEIINGLTSAGKSKPHNLVVADHHNYFVGQSKVLTHDIIVRGPTTVVVPGPTKNN